MRIHNMTRWGQWEHLSLSFNDLHLYLLISVYRGAGMSQTAPNSLNRLSRIITFSAVLSWQFSVGCWNFTSCSMPRRAWNWSSMIFESNMTWSLMNFIMGLSAHFRLKETCNLSKCFFNISKRCLGHRQKPEI